MLNEYELKILKTIDNFKNGFAKITDVIKAIEVDLLDTDIIDLKNYINEWQEKNKK